MDIERHVQAIQADLAAAAALGDEAAAAAGHRLAAAVGSSLQLRLLDVLTEATLALNGQLSSGHVEVRLAGRDPDLVLVEDGAGEGEPSARTGRRSQRAHHPAAARRPEGADRDGRRARGRLDERVDRAGALRGRSSAPAPLARADNRLQGFAQS